jgi:hypothetical protein
MTDKHYSGRVIEDENGEMILPLPEEMLKELDWKIGDTLQWEDNKDGSYILSKKESTESEWVLVETVSMFRLRYMVEVPAGNKDWALDTVTMEDAKEFSQKHMAENIVSHRVVSTDEILRICDEDNEYCNSWSDEKKMEVFCTHIGEHVEKG